MNIHINILELKEVWLALDTFKDRVFIEDLILMSSNTLKKKRTCLSRHLQVSQRGSGTVGMAHHVHLSKIHSEKKEHSNRPAKSSRSGHPCRMVSSSLGI